MLMMMMVVVESNNKQKNEIRYNIIVIVIIISGKLDKNGEIWSIDTNRKFEREDASVRCQR